MGIFSLLQDLPNPGIKLRSPIFQADSLPSEPPGKCFELAVSNIGWRLLNWNSMLCKGSALSKSHFLLWKRNVVEPNDVTLTYHLSAILPFFSCTVLVLVLQDKLTGNFYPVMWICCIFIHSILWICLKSQWVEHALTFQLDDKLMRTETGPHFS